MDNTSWTYACTPARQLSSDGSSNSIFDWTGTGDATVNTTPDGLNRDAAIAAAGGYDGNLTNDGVWAFTYDGDNHLIGETATGAAMVSSTALRRGHPTEGVGPISP